MKYYSIEKKMDLNGDFGEIANALIVEKQSKFYAYVFKTDNEEIAMSKVEEIRKANPHARHVVYIYSIFKNNIANIRFSDDGEPQGTGTKAIYELLEKEGITNICIVIVRYFGGILLGAGPLSRTYLNSAREALDNCTKKEILNYLDYSFVLEYNGYNIFKNRVEEYINNEIVIIEECNFNEKVEVKVRVVDEYLERITKLVEEIGYGSK